MGSGDTSIGRQHRTSALRRKIGVGLLLAAFTLPGCATSDAALARREERARAEREADRAAAKKPPETLEDKIHSGDILLGKGQVERSLMTYLDAVRMDPDAALPRERIGYLQLAHDPERAEAIFLSQVEAHPEDAAAIRGLGLARLGLGRLAEAQESLERSLEIEPDSANSHYALAAVLSLRGRHGEALHHNNRAAELEPNNASIVNGLGVTYLLLGEFELAERTLRDAIRLDSTTPAYHNNLGIALARQERYDEALYSFRRAGSEQAARNNLGYAYLLNGRPADAVREYERALAEEGDQKAQIMKNLRYAVTQQEASTAKRDSD